MSEQESGDPDRKASGVTGELPGSHGSAQATDFDARLEAVLAAIDEQELLRFARELVSVPSVYRPGETGGNEQRAAGCVAEYLEREGLDVRVEEAAPGRPNVWATWNGDRPGKTLLFEGHTDVVTEGRTGEWRHGPFDAEVVGGTLYGRGSCDTKGNLAAAVMAVRAIKTSGVAFSGHLLLCHPVDEEGMMLGIKDFIRRGRAEGVDGAVICEPEENQICIAQKGAMRVEVAVRGRMAHGAMPLSGVNPVTRAARFVVAVEELEKEEIARHGEDPLLGYPSLTPTVLLGPQAGEPQINVIPAGAYVALDIRTVPSQSHEELVGRLEEILERLHEEDAAFDAALRVIEERPPTETPKSDPLVGAMDAAYSRLTGEPPRYNGVPGATDGTFLHAWAGVPIVTTGAGGRTVPHHVDEWIDLDELVQTCKLYAATAMYFCYAEDENV